ncbi:hypothetical protein ES703_124264 [subsurface metagenome]
MLDEDAKEALQGTKKSPMHHVRPVFPPILADECHVKALRQVKVELDGCTLPGATQGVLDLYVNLGPVEDRLAFFTLVG